MAADRPSGNSTVDTTADVQACQRDYEAAQAAAAARGPGTPRVQAQPHTQHRR